MTLPGYTTITLLGRIAIASLTSSAQSPSFLWMTRPTNKPTPRPDNSATARLHAHAPAAHALFKEGKKLAREKRRKEWYAKHGGAK